MPGNYSLYPQQNSTEPPRFDPKQNLSTSSVDPIACNEAVVATALSKCVFKQGRRTVSPALMLRQSNLLPQKSLDELLPQEVRISETCSRTSSDSGIEVDMGEEDQKSQTNCIEQERQRGMKIAITLSAQGQDPLELEFTAAGEALGRHTDGTGVHGVISTLLNLAHIKKKQVL